MERLSKLFSSLKNETLSACKNKLVFECYIVVVPFITL